MKLLGTPNSNGGDSNAPPQISPPIVDVQDFSSSPAGTHDTEAGQLTQASGDSPTSELPPKQEPAPRKLSRGASIKSLFGGGSKAPKTTPTCLSPTSTPKCHASPSRTSPSPGPESAKKQFLQVIHKHCFLH